MVREKGEGGKQKTGERKRRRDQGRQEFEVVHDIRNLSLDEEEQKRLVGRGGEGEDSESESEDVSVSSPRKQAVSSKHVLGDDDDDNSAGKLQHGAQNDFSEEEEEENEQSQAHQQRSPSKKEKTDEEEDKEREKAERERLAEIRKKREEDKARRLEKEAADKVQAEKDAEEKKKKKEEEKKEAENSPELLALRTAFAKLLPEVGTSKSLNQLNQEKDCKNLLKPLLKKATIKQLNKASLQQITAGAKKDWEISTGDDNVVHLKRLR
ncbi:unnamed protein product [Amoebophrya sp. A120]|nr:unnamed protein product [Amoebophrya sp. A120]|eukprot:GSA120T00017107001.1